MKSKGFHPTEIIFSTTTACNLHCEHCFINRTPRKLEISDAVRLIESCVKSGGQPGPDGNPLSVIDRIGFSGGEPFLYMDFLIEVTKAAISHDLMFDQIMTNGDWWRDETELTDTLQKLYDAGYDGKIGLSWDSYHGQTTERMETFIRAVQKIFDEDSINIQTVEDQGALRGVNSEAVVKPPVEGVASNEVRARGRLSPPEVPVYALPRTFTSEDARAWKARHWFKEDYCQGPGNIFYVHADGNIAPCCGFANENPALLIGTIHDSFESIMQKAAANPMIKICYEEGLSHYRRHGIKKSLRSQEKKLPGKCSDICSFCDYVCKL
ncbi:MAG: radical SAM protein [Spirochaetales bacterium]|nr:radical SAM protein [Spirochaetales bacterium]